MKKPRWWDWNFFVGVLGLLAAFAAAYYGYRTYEETERARAVFKKTTAPAMEAEFRTLDYALIEKGGEFQKFLKQDRLTKPSAVTFRIPRSEFIERFMDKFDMFGDAGIWMAKCMADVFDVNDALDRFSERQLALDKAWDRLPAWRAQQEDLRKNDPFYIHRQDPVDALRESAEWIGRRIEDSARDCAVADHELVVAARVAIN